MANILIISDAPHSNTGLGRVAKELGKRLTGANRVVFAANMVGCDETTDFEVHSVRRMDDFNTEDVKRFWQIIHDIIKKHNIDVVFHIGDPWTILDAEKFKAVVGIPIVSYLTIDGSPLSILYKNLVNSLDSVICFSEYGKKVLEVAGIQSKIDVVYPGIDHMNDFVDIKFARPDMLKNRFVIGWFGANSPRKDLFSALSIFADFAQKKDDVVLLVNTYKNGVVNPFEWVKNLELQKKVILSVESSPTVGLEASRYYSLMNMCDVGLFTAIGEGFGLIVPEFLRLGKIVVAPENTTFPELLGYGERGFICRCKPMMGMRNQLRWTTYNNDFVRTLNKIYNETKKKRDFSKMINGGIEFAKTLRWDDTAAKIEKIIVEAVESANSLNKISIMA